MARIKDIENKKKRTKTVLLDKEAYMIFRRRRDVNPGWNFSQWVCNMLKMKDVQNKSNVIATQIKELKAEKAKRDEMYENQIRGLVVLMSQEAQKEHRRLKKSGEKYESARTVVEGIIQ